MKTYTKENEEGFWKLVYEIMLEQTAKLKEIERQLDNLCSKVDEESRFNSKVKLLVEKVKGGENE